MVARFRPTSRARRIRESEKPEAFTHTIPGGGTLKGNDKGISTYEGPAYNRYQLKKKYR